MAEENERDLIGFDPLAWMLQSEEERSTPPVTLDCPQPESEAQPIAEQWTESLDADDGEAWVDDELATSEVGNAMIVLEPVLSIQDVGQRYECFLAALERSDKIDIDASAVASIDTANLQLLLILKRTAIKQHKQVSIDFPSDKFIEACELLGLSEMLEVDQAVAGFF